MSTGVSDVPDVPYNVSGMSGMSGIHRDPREMGETGEAGETGDPHQEQDVLGSMQTRQSTQSMQSTQSKQSRDLEALAVVLTDEMRRQHRINLILVHEINKLKAHVDDLEFTIEDMAWWRDVLGPPRHEAVAVATVEDGSEEEIVWVPLDAST